MSRTSVSRKRRAALLAPAALVASLALAGPLASATGSSGGAARTSADSPVTHFTYTEGGDGHRRGDHDQTEYNTKA
ncbi:hypothetical protein [Streptomyces sp. NPDC001678]|uniref:hypothetical protein n=1 Tax=Streptomyces sp. NPDC001678 TaxID=3364599 RepID=UPI00368F0A14